MSLGKTIQAARKRKKITLSELGSSVGLAKSSLSLLENDNFKNSPDHKTLIRIAEALNAPEILIYHCQECPIRQHIMLRHYPELNNIRTDPASIVAKMRKEMQEAIDAADQLGEKYLKVDFKNDPDYQHVFFQAMEQILDVERVIETLKFELILHQVHTHEEIQQVVDHQQQKCIEHGHHKPEIKEAV